MANRYWVGGTASWNGTAGTKWSTTSGGAGGQAEPTSSDDVFFDGNSGVVTVTRDSGISNANNLNFTGFTGTFAGANDTQVFGNFTLGSGMTYSFTGNLNLVNLTTYSITTNGVSISSGLLFGGGDESGGGTCTVQDDITCTGVIQITKGTFNANNKNITCQSMQSSGTATRTINMGSGTWTMTGAVNWSCTGATGLTLNANTSTIKLTDATSSTKTFGGNGYTYNNLWITGAGTGAYIIAGSNTFADFKIDTPPHTVSFTAGTTQTVSTFTVNGSSGNLITLQSTSAGSAWTLSKSSGTISVTYCSIKDSTGTGGAIFNANDGTSVNVSGNSNWNFALSSVLGLCFFYSLLYK